MRRALCIALALLMLLTVVPLTVFAEETETRTFETGEIIAFGSYPQSEVTDEELKNTLTAAAGSTDNWTSYNYYIEDVQSNYMKYTDVEYDGAKYRGVYFTQYRPLVTDWSSSTDNSDQDDNGYSTSTIYWFKYEPMKWQVLSYDSTTGEAIVLSKSIIDSQQYYNNTDNRTINGATVYPNNYEHSDIRTWLNNTFYNTAFGTSEKNAIVATTLDNSAYSTSYSEYDSNSTTDNVWLLSYSEAQNTAYGFTSDTNSTETRQATGTEYALNQGLWKSTSNGCSGWRLRSAGSYYYMTCYVYDDGSVYNEFNYVNFTIIGVRPALTLKLTSVIDPTEPTTEETTVEPIEETTTVPTTEPTTKPSEEPTTKPSEESTKPTTEPTTEPSEETTTKPSEESTTKSSEESTTKSGEEPTTNPSEEPTTKPGEESTTKSGEESTTKPSEESTTKSSEESTTKPTTEPTTKPAAEDSDGSTTKGECSHICHKSGIAKFFYKILRFFWKLFKINKVCDCGFEHY